jgi:hypothetical protein
MENAAGPSRHSSQNHVSVRECAAKSRMGRKRLHVALMLLAFGILLAILSPLLSADGSPTITTVDPTSGKVNDSITINGQNLGKPKVNAVFLSDDKNDYKAVILEQGEDKIVMKVPQVKPGGYNVSIGEGTAIYIQPVRFSVE